MSQNIVPSRDFSNETLTKIVIRKICHKRPSFNRKTLLWKTKLERSKLYHKRLSAHGVLTEYNIVIKDKSWNNTAVENRLIRGSYDAMFHMLY